EQRMIIVQVHDLAVREHTPHSLEESFPLLRTEEAVAEQEAAALQVVTQLHHHFFFKVPGSGQSDNQVGPVEYIIAVLEVHRLLDRAHIDGGEPPEDAGVIAVALGVVDRPGRAALAPVAAAAPAK